MAAGRLRQLRRGGHAGVVGAIEEPAEDTRECEVSGPAFSGILPMLERQDGYPPIGQAGPERPILKVIMVHGVGTHVPGYSARLSANLARSLGLTVVAPDAKGFPDRGAGLPRRDARHADRHAPHQHGPRSGDAVLRAHLVADQPAGQGGDRLRQHRGLRSPAGERQQPVQALHQRRRPRSPGLHRHRTRAYPGDGGAGAVLGAQRRLAGPAGRAAAVHSWTIRPSPRASTSTSSRSSPTVSAAGSPPTA